MVDPAIKREPRDEHVFPSVSGNGTNGVKLEPEDVKMSMDDLNEDDDEDSLDLDTSKSDTKVWLVRLPRFLLDKWSDPDTLNGQELGKVRIMKQSDDPNDKGEVKLLLDDTPLNQDIPHEYNISLTKKVVDNTYVFTEKDFPKYDKKKNDAEMAAIKQEQQQQQQRGKNGKATNNLLAKDRFVPYVKTIPKRTALVGKVYHECNVIPSVSDPNYNRVISQRRQLQEEEPRQKVTLLSEPPGVTTGAFSQTLRGQSNMFMRAQKKESKAASEGKATRIPRNELLDMLFKLFESYQYWSLKGLKENTKQPEIYLKEVLDEIAVLIKKGPYSMKYSLKPEFKNRKQGEEDGQNPDDDAASAGGNAANNPDEDEDDDDDENLEMENVV